MKSTVKIIVVLLLFLLLTLKLDAQEVPQSSAGISVQLVGGWVRSFVPEEGLGEHTTQRGCIVVHRENEAGPTAIKCVPTENLETSGVQRCFMLGQHHAVCHIFMNRSLTDEEQSLGETAKNFLQRLGMQGLGALRFSDLHCSISLAIPSQGVPILFPPEIDC